MGPFEARCGMTPGLRAPPESSADSSAESSAVPY